MAQLIDFLKHFSEDRPSPVASTSGDNAAVRMPKRKRSFELLLDYYRRLRLHQELVDAAKSFTLYFQPSDNAPVTTSNLLIDYSATPISFVPPQDPPKKTEPVPKKKRAKKVNRGHVVMSNHANEQMQIVCYDTLATPPTEQPKKKRKITPKIKSGPVVKNEVTERLQKFITSDEMNGSDLKLVIQKVLYMSDLKKDQNRLSLPMKKLETEDFLTVEEKLALENEKEIEVRLVGPTLEMFKEPMMLKIWDMNKNHNLVLITNWYHFVKENEKHLEELSKIQLWSFRKDHQLCFALAVVARPPDSINTVAN